MGITISVSAPDFYGILRVLFVFGAEFSFSIHYDCACTPLVSQIAARVSAGLCYSFFGGTKARVSISMTKSGTLICTIE